MEFQGAMGPAAAAIIEVAAPPVEAEESLATYKVKN